MHIPCVGRYQYVQRAVTTFFAMQTKDDRLLESVSNIYEAIPKADICVHYSIKWNYSGSEEHAMDLLNRFLEELSQLKGAKSVLLLSGGGKKKKLDTIKVIPDPSCSCVPLRQKPSAGRIKGDLQLCTM